MVWAIVITSIILILQAVIAIAVAGGSTTMKAIGELRERLTTRGRITIFFVIASAVLGIVKELITSAAIKERDQTIRIQIGEINHLKETINNYELGKLAPGKTSLKESIMGEWELSEIKLQNIAQIRKTMKDKEFFQLQMAVSMYEGLAKDPFWGGNTTIDFKDDFSISAYTTSNLTGEVKPTKFLFHSYTVEGDSLLLDNSHFSYNFGENGNALILRNDFWRMQLTKF